MKLLQTRSTGYVRLQAVLRSGLIAGIGMLTLLAISQGSAGGAMAALPTNSTSPANANMQYGLVMSLLGNNPAVKRMGYQWVQYGIYWKDAEPSPGAYDWGNVDNVVNAARDAGLNVLIRVSRPPQWARDPSCASVDTCPPASVEDFGVFSASLANHVRGRIAPYRVAYEIWNEPNTSVEWGDMCPEPARYADMLRAAYPQIKGADPGAIVVAGAVTTVAERRLAPNECHIDDITFLEGMYSAGASPYFDVLSDHPYGYISAPEADPVTGSTGLVFRRAERHRAVMVEFGDSAKQIWATEIGWSIDPATEGSSCSPPDWYFVFSPQEQADYLVRAHQWARSYWPWMGAMFVFNFDFNEAPWYGTCDAFRFWAVKGRPAQAELASLTRNPPPTYTVVVPTATPVDFPPLASAVRYNTTSFNSSGGTLTVEVDATDNDSTPVDEVQANVQYPDGGSQLYNFTLVSGTATSGTWRASIDILANSSSGTQTYSVSPYVIESFPTRRTAAAPVQQISVTNTRFSDVPSDMWAYTYIEYMVNQGAVTGYMDNTFRPNSVATRAQLAKIIVLGFHFPRVSPGTAHFTDVPVGSTFYSYVETAYSRGLVSGYTCGGPGEPCDPGLRPYFRPGFNVSRGQIAKITVLAAGWVLANPTTPTFQDVPSGSVFYSYVETAYAHGIISGYTCGGPGEPCVSDNKPYFRPGFSATRAQICKLVYSAVTQASPTPTPTATATILARPTATVTATPASVPTK